MSTQSAPTAPASQAAASPALPDINAQTYPFEVVESLLNQAAYFNLLSVPDTPFSPIRHNGGQVIGWQLTERLHRFVSEVAQPTRKAPLRTQQRVGEPLGHFSHRWLLVPDDFEALPGLEPPPTALDPSRQQRFVMLDSVCQLGDDADGFAGFGTGVTYPVSFGGRAEIHVAAIGTLMEGYGRFSDHEATTYTYCGTLQGERGFQGSLMIRAMDPQDTLHTRRELPPMTPEPYPDTDVTYVVLKGRKSGPASKTRYLFSPDGQVRGLEVHQQISAVVIDADGGERGLTSRTQLGRVIGRMRSEIAFNLFNPGAPGTSVAPIPFGAVNYLTLFDEDGRELGGFVADGGEGRTFNLTFPNAPKQRGLRFGGVGPLRHGSGPFAGIQGLMTDNSVVGLAPHVTSTLYVLRIHDPEGRYREAFGSPSPPASPPEVSPPKQPGPAFDAIVRQKDALHDAFRGWRRDFQRCPDVMSNFIAETYERLREVGDFNGLSFDPAVLSSAMAGDVAPYDPVVFERYQGRARAVFKTYRLDTHEMLNSAELFSTWDHATITSGQRKLKQITGSHQGYFSPAELPPLEDNKVDLLVNSYHPETGVTSYVSMYQLGRAERASISYKLSGEHEVMWFVKDVSQGGQPVNNNVFMASHEWREERDGKVYYPMIGIFFEMDFERCRIDVFGDRFWKALYVEES